MYMRLRLGRKTNHPDHMIFLCIGSTPWSQYASHLRAPQMCGADGHENEPCNSLEYRLIDSDGHHVRWELPLSYSAAKWCFNGEQLFGFFCSWVKTCYFCGATKSKLPQF